MPPGVTEEISGHGKLSRSAHYAPVAQRIEHPPPKRGAAGSIPAGRETSLLEGLAPLELPRTLARGGPAIPAPLAWLTRCRSFAPLINRGASAPRTPLHARSRGPCDPRSARVAHSLPLVRGKRRRGGKAPLELPNASLQVCETHTSSRPSLTLVGTCCARCESRSWPSGEVAPMKNASSGFTSRASLRAGCGIVLLLITVASGEWGSSQALSTPMLTSGEIVSIIGSDVDARGAISAVLTHAMAQRSKREFFLATQMSNEWLPSLPGVELVRLTDSEIAAHVANCGLYWVVNRIERSDNVVSLSLSQKCGGASLTYIVSFDERGWRLGPPATGKDRGGWVPGTGSGIAGPMSECPCL